MNVGRRGHNGRVFTVPPVVVTLDEVGGTVELAASLLLLAVAGLPLEGAANIKRKVAVLRRFLHLLLSSHRGR